MPAVIVVTDGASVDEETSLVIVVVDAGGMVCVELGLSALLEEDEYEVEVEAATDVVGDALEVEVIVAELVDGEAVTVVTETFVGEAATIPFPELMIVS